MTFESGISSRICAKLRTLGAKAEKLHATEYTKVGEPDIYGSYKGRAFVLETKTATGRLRPAQRVRLREWRDAGAIVGVPRNVPDAVRIVTTGEGQWDE